MKHNLRLVLSILAAGLNFFSIPVRSQEPAWDTYRSTESIKSLLVEGDFVWVGENGPVAQLVKYNRLTNEKTLLNKTNSGLPDNSVWAIVSDSSSSKWLGTKRGLVRYDGQNWTTYDPTNSGLPDTLVTALITDSSGALWIGTIRSGSFGVGDLGGLARFDGSSWTVYRMENSALPNNNITSLAKASNGTIWVGTFNGLLRINGSVWDVYTATNSELPDNAINSLTVDSQNTVWIGTGYGIARFDGSLWTRYHVGNSDLADNYVTSLYADNNRILVGSRGGLQSFDGITWTTSPNPMGTSVNVVAADQAGEIWFGTNLRLGKFNGIGITEFNIGNSGLPNNNVFQISIDSLNNKWICTSTGLAKFDGLTWSIFDAGNLPLSNGRSDMSAVATENNGAVWVGVVDGILLQIRPDSIWVYDQSNSPINGRITSIVIDGQGAKWIGTFGFGLFKLVGDNWYSYNSTNSDLTDDFINAILNDRQGRIWVATNDGAFRQADSAWVQYRPAFPGSLANQVASIADDSSGSLWLGTYGAGLFQFDSVNVVWTNYHTNNSGIPDNYVYSICIDRENNKWLATGVEVSTGGLSRFDGQTWTNYDASNSPLGVNNISFVTTDHSGNLWIGTLGGGVAQFRQNVTGVNSDSHIPQSFRVRQNYPNPFNPTTTIEFDIPQSGLVTLKVFNILGQEIETIIDEVKEAGSYSFKFKAYDLSSGIYLYQLRLRGSYQTRKMILVR